MQTRRRDFLKAAGAVGVAGLIPARAQDAKA